MAEYYGATGGGKYTGAKPAVSWDIGAGSARTTGSAPANAPAPAPAPIASTTSYSSVPSRAIAPVSNYAGPQSNPYNTGPLTTRGAQLLGNAPAQQSFAPPTPPPPPAPPVGGAKWYGGLDQGSRAAQDQSWLGGDSDYTSQIAEYDRALQTFIDRIANQKKMFNQDADDAVASTGRNQAMSLDALGEDFGARGLSYSGMFDTTKNQTNERFNDAKGGIEKVRSRNLSDADNREADYRTENQISRGNAERSSLSRQAQRQALLDSMAGF